jgi:hypothetical protein
MLAVGGWPAPSHARWTPLDIGLLTKAKKHAEARRLGYTKRRGKPPGQSTPLCLTHAHLHVFAVIIRLSTGKAGESAEACGVHLHSRSRLAAPSGSTPGGSQIGRGQTLE